MPIHNYIRLREEEKIVMIVRRWLPTYLMWYVLIFVLLVGPFFFFFPLMRAGTFGKILFGISVIFGVVLWARIWYTWRRDCLVITNVRIIDINQLGFAKRTISEASYERVADVSHLVHGVFHSLFNFGSVKITCGDGSVVLAIDRVKNPKEVHHVISEMMERFFEQLHSRRRRKGSRAMIDQVQGMSTEELEAVASLVLDRLENMESSTSEDESPEISEEV